MNKGWVADFILLMITAVWGTTFVLIKAAIVSLPPFSFLAVRFSIAFLLISIVIGFKNKFTKQNINIKTHIVKGVMLGIFLFAAFALQTTSLLFTTSGKSAFLTGLYVALVPIFSFLILKNTIKIFSIVGVISSLVGLYLLAFSNLSEINPGDILAFLCAIFFTFHIVFTGRFSKSSSTIHLVAIQLLTVSILSGISSVIFEPGHLITNPSVIFSASVMIALLFTAILSTAMTLIAQTYVQKFTNPARVALIFTMEPVFAALFDYWWNGVIISGSAFIGCLFILGGMILAENPFTTYILNKFKKRGQFRISKKDLTGENLK